MDTNLKDKFNKPINIGDKVQYKLGGKGRGPINMTVAKRRGKIVGLSYDNRGREIVLVINNGNCSYISIVERAAKKE